LWQWELRVGVGSRSWEGERRGTNMLETFKGKKNAMIASSQVNTGVVILE